MKYRLLMFFFLNGIYRRVTEALAAQTVVKD